MSISVQLDCANVGDGKLEVAITLYDYSNGDPFKGIKYINNDFDATDAFDDACQVNSGTNQIGVSSNLAASITCQEKAVSYWGKVTL